MDIKKLKYDLAMQCALADYIKNPPEDISPRFDERIYVMDKFESYYRHFSDLDKSRWERFKKLDED